MAGHILNLNGHQSARTPDLAFFDSFLATPVILTPGMDDGAIGHGFDQMLNRSRASHDFVSGKISAEDFAEALYENGYDPDVTFDLWEDGVSLL